MKKLKTYLILIGVVVNVNIFSQVNSLNVENFFLFDELGIDKFSILSNQISKKKYRKIKNDCTLNDNAVSFSDYPIILVKKTPSFFPLVYANEILNEKHGTYVDRIFHLTQIRDSLTQFKYWSKIPLIIDYKYLIDHKGISGALYENDSNSLDSSFVYNIYHDDQFKGLERRFSFKESGLNVSSFVNSDNSLENFKWCGGTDGSGDVFQVIGVKPNTIYRDSLRYSLSESIFQNPPNNIVDLQSKISDLYKIGNKQFIYNLTPLGIDSVWHEIDKSKLNIFEINGIESYYQRVNKNKLNQNNVLNLDSSDLFFYIKKPYNCMLLSEVDKDIFLAPKYKKIEYYPTGKISRFIKSKDNVTFYYNYYFLDDNTMIRVIYSLNGLMQNRDLKNYLTEQNTDWNEIDLTKIKSAYMNKAIKKELSNKYIRKEAEFKNSDNNSYRLFTEFFKNKVKIIEYLKNAKPTEFKIQDILACSLIIKQSDKHFTIYDYALKNLHALEFGNFSNSSDWKIEFKTK